LASPVFGQGEVIPSFEQDLPTAEKNAKEFSGNLKSSSSSAEAARHQAEAAHAPLLPNLSLQGNYYYQTQVPSLTEGPLGTLTFGTHNNYTVGPVLSYTVFDGGKDRNNLESNESLAKSRHENYRSQERQLELMVRQAYFQVQYGLKQLVLTSDSLKLSQSQSQDIDLRFRAGAASRLDQVTAHRDVMNYQLKFRQAQTDLASSLRGLFALVGESRPFDTARPVPAELASNLPAGVEEPTVQVKLDALEVSLGGFGQEAFQAPKGEHPEVQALEHQAESSRLASESERSGLWPKLQFQAKSQLQYPNVVLPENVIQNTIGATLTFPLFEGDASRNRAAQKLSEAMASEFQKQQKLSDLSRDYHKAYDFLKSLKAQQKVNDANVREAEEVQKLTYRSFRAGKVRYLDVEDANLKLLQAQVTAAQIESQVLTQIATLKYLSDH
jgi:outer membrane protein